MFDEGGFAGSFPGTDGNGRGGCTVVAVVSPIFAMLLHSSTTTEGSCGGGLGCDDEECNKVVGDRDHAPMSNRVKLGPNRTGEGDVLRGIDGSRGRFEDESWNSSSYSCWESGSNELGKDRQGVGGGVVVVLGNSVSSGLLVVAVGFLLAPLLLAPKRPRSRGLLMSVDLAYPSSPTYTSVWRDGSGKPETERAILVRVKVRGDI